MTNLICPICSQKEGKANKSGLYKHNQENSNFWVIICFHCGWETKPFHHHDDLQIPTKNELKIDWR